MKLTLQQEQALKDLLHEKRFVGKSDGYSKRFWKPLIAAGYAQVSARTASGAWVELTDAGRAAVAPTPCTLAEVEVALADAIARRNAAEQFSAAWHVAVAEVEALAGEKARLAPKAEVPSEEHVALAEWVMSDAYDEE